MKPKVAPICVGLMVVLAVSLAACTVSPSLTQVSPTAIPATTIPTPTQEATVGLPAAIMAVAAPETGAPLVSHNGVWQAQTVRYPCSTLPDTGEQMALEQLNLIRVSDGAVTPAAEQVIACGGLGAFGLAGLFWSEDDRYFFYTDAREGVPDGCGYWQRPILRLDPTTAQSERLGPGVASPDETTIALWQNRELVVLDANGSEMGRLAAERPEAEIGTIAFSPQNDALVYLQTSSYCPPGPSTLVHVALDTLQSRPLIEDAASTWRTINWSEEAAIVLSDAMNKQWRYQLDTGDLSEVQ